MTERRKTRELHIGSVTIGGENAVAVQSMTNTDTRDAAATLRQIEALTEAGCEIVRLAVPDAEAAQSLRTIRAGCRVPLVADIHFDWRLAIECVQAGVDKIRLNPGNIGGPERVRAVADACRERGIPIRIGVNGGSLEKELLAKFGAPTADAMVESAKRHIRLLEDCGFFDIAVSLKASDVQRTIEAYRKLAACCDYPLHLGVTEAGTERMGVIKAAAAFGSLLCDGIGDTVRVSLTADPVREVAAAFDILKAIGVRKRGVDIVSCPTCGRCRVDLIGLAEAFEKEAASIDKQVKVAVMGCAVNGPGEAREADVGVACGKGDGLIFRRGEILYKVPQAEIIPALLREIDKL